MSREFTFTDGTKLTVGTMYCIGRNYALHAEEMGTKVPAEPIVFIKPPAAFVTSGSKIKLPEYSNNVHHEVELVVVIGMDSKGVSRENARDIIAGYGVGIDLTLRDLQAKAKEKGKPWAAAKGFYGSAPISNIIPANEIKTNLFDIRLEVNGQLRQIGKTKDMERSVETLIEYISHVFTLRKGDCIFTGTPQGVARIVSGDIIRAKLDNKISLDIEIE